MRGEEKMFGKRERRERLRPQTRNQFFWEGRCAREWRGLWVCPIAPESSFPGRAVAWVSPGGHLQGTESQKLLSPTRLGGRERPGPDGPFGQELELWAANRGG